MTTAARAIVELVRRYGADGALPWLQLASRMGAPVSEPDVVIALCSIPSLAVAAAEVSDDERGALLDRIDAAVTGAVAILVAGS